MNIHAPGPVPGPFAVMHVRAKQGAQSGLYTLWANTVTFALCGVTVLCVEEELLVDFDELEEDEEDVEEEEEDEE